MIKPGPVQPFILAWASNCRIRTLSVRCDNLWCDEKCNFLINENMLVPEELQFCKWFKFSLTDFPMIVRPIHQCQRRADTRQCQSQVTAYQSHCLAPVRQHVQNLYWHIECCYLYYAFICFGTLIFPRECVIMICPLALPAAHGFHWPAHYLHTVG